MHDSDLVEYEQARYELMTKAIPTIFAEVNQQIEEFGNIIREGGKKYLEEFNRATDEVCKTRVCENALKGYKATSYKVSTQANFKKTS